MTISIMLLAFLLAMQVISSLTLSKDMKGGSNGRDD